MKEATGELNMTVVTVVAIAAIAAFFAAFVLPAIKDRIDAQNKCANAVCPVDCTTQTCQCSVVAGESTDTVTCPNPNYKSTT